MAVPDPSGGPAATRRTNSRTRSMPMRTTVR